MIAKIPLQLLLIDYLIIANIQPNWSHTYR